MQPEWTDGGGVYTYRVAAMTVGGVITRRGETYRAEVTNWRSEGDSHPPAKDHETLAAAKAWVEQHWAPALARFARNG